MLSCCVLTPSLCATPQGTTNESLKMTYTITFSHPVLEKVTVGEQVFDRVKVDDLPEVGDYGEPLLPVQELRLLIPYGYTIRCVDTESPDPIFLGQGYVLEPESNQIPFSQMKHALPTTEMNTTSDIFPETLVDIIGIYGFRGYQILILTLNPVHYAPLTGELSYYPAITITLQLEKRSLVTINDLYRDSTTDRRELTDKVDNFDDSTRYPSLEKHVSEDYTLLIITTDALKPGFESLTEFHTSQGLPTRIATLTDIGSTDPEAIRQYIRTEYLTKHIDYVLLGGDADLVPARMLWVTDGYGDTTELPADLYYGCLDGTYNYDGDDKWGEPKDGDNGGDVDLIAEVYVGRACVGDSDEVDNFIHKTISYIYTVDPYQEKVLMVGEFLWPDPDTYGGDYMDELINGSTANDYNTTGIPSDDYTIDKLYDRDWPGHDWPKEELIDRIDNNVHFINHLGHSAFNYNMKLFIDDADALTNTRYFFAYSQGCDNGGFDNPFGIDCIAEHFTIKTDHGAFAVIANARYGFGESGGTDGANQRYHREFIDAIYGENIIQLGRANQDSKEDNLFMINTRPMRWCYYEINLLGDPTIDFFTHYNNSIPATPPSPNGPADGEVGVDYTYTIQANTDPEGDQTYYKFYWGDGQSSQWLGPCNPGETANATHTWTTAGMYTVVVKCRDIYWGMSNLSEAFQVEITGPFFEIEVISGGFCTASAIIENNGEGTARNVKRSIRVEGVSNKNIFYVTNSTIDSLRPEETTRIQSDKPILGFGKVQITAAASSPGGKTYSKTVNGFVLFFLVFITR